MRERDYSNPPRQVSTYTTKQIENKKPITYAHTHTYQREVLISVFIGNWKGFWKICTHNLYACFFSSAMLIHGEKGGL